MSKKCLFGKKLQKSIGLSNFQFQRKKSILTSPKLSEFHNKLENLLQRHFGTSAQKLAKRLRAFFSNILQSSCDFYLNYLFNVVIIFLIQYCKAP